MSFPMWHDQFVDTSLPGRTASHGTGLDEDFGKISGKSSSSRLPQFASNFSTTPSHEKHAKQSIAEQKRTSRTFKRSVPR